MTLSMNLFRASGKKAVLSDNKLTHSLRIEKQMVQLIEPSKPQPKENSPDNKLTDEKYNFMPCR